VDSDEGGLEALIMPDEAQSPVTKANRISGIEVSIILCRSTRNLSTATSNRLVLFLPLM
jgi:hypothetical protein